MLPATIRILITGSTYKALLREYQTLLRRENVREWARHIEVASRCNPMDGERLDAAHASGSLDAPLASSRSPAGGSLGGAVRVAGAARLCAHFEFATSSMVCTTSSSMLSVVGLRAKYSLHAVCCARRSQAR